MANKFEQLIEYIVNSEEQKAQDLFHEIVVEKSREIYENIIDDETAELEEAEETEEEAVEEAVEDAEEAVEEAVEEVEENIYTDQTDDLINSVVADEVAEEDDEEMDMEPEMEPMGDEEGEEEGEEEEGEEEIEDRVDDLEAALDALKQEFDALMDQPAEPEMGEGIVREYDEKAPAPVTSEKTDSKDSPVAKDGGADPDDAEPADFAGGDEKGMTPEKAQDMGGTTEPDMKEV